MTVKRFSVPGEGIGKDDYSREVFAGRIRPGVSLKVNQSFKLFGVTFSDIPSPFPFIKPKLGVGGSEHIVDFETGLPSPYTVAQGYTLDGFQAQYSFSQDAIMRTYLDGSFEGSLGVPGGGAVLYVAQIISWGTSVFDPTGATSHTYDIQIVNLGNGDLEGAGTVIGILEVVGTLPLPTTKTVLCKFCGYMETIPKETKNWICPECNQLNIFFDLSKFRGTP